MIFFFVGFLIGFVVGWIIHFGLDSFAEEEHRIDANKTGLFAEHFWGGVKRVEKKGP